MGFPKHPPLHPWSQLLLLPLAEILSHLGLAGHTWVLQGDVNLGPNDVVALLQGVGSHCGPLAAGVDEQDIPFTDALSILPCERKEEKEQKRKSREEEKKDWVTFPSPLLSKPLPGDGAL